MVLLVDLDGTLTNTVHPSWKPYKDGKSIYSVDDIPFFDGALSFVRKRMSMGDVVLIVSDSHPLWVNQIAGKIGAGALWLADKPNTIKLQKFLTDNQIVVYGDAYFIGDSSLDIETGRKLGIKTIWIQPYQISDEIKNNKDGIGDIMRCIKMGPTYAVKSYDEMNSILDAPSEYLYSIEGAFEGVHTTRPIIFFENHRTDGTCTTIYCLARQEQGFCDCHSKAIKYYDFQKEDRTSELLSVIACGVSNFINQDCFINQRWDYFTFIPDKETTRPKNKLKELFDLVESHVEKKELLCWNNLILGSLRQRQTYMDRKQFLEDHLSVIPTYNLQGKNIIVMDDQLTTGATAWFVIDKLKKAGAANVMFITLFQMILNVSPYMQCPQCGGSMLVKINKNNGKRFFTCLPQKYGGDGCGYIINID